MQRKLFNNVLLWCVYFNKRFHSSTILYNKFCSNVNCVYYLCTNMEDLIHTINKLQDVISVIGCESLQLPQIVVVGAQSSGKSSVLESIVGRSFLPKGPGTITRRPIILQLLHNKTYEYHDAEEVTNQEWAVFSHKKHVMFKDFNSVRQEIEQETEKVAGKNKAVYNEPIHLKIFSNRIHNLTLIDLPGLTKVPVGDQPPDIEIKIKELVLNYISNSNCIILAVVTANTDMATSESLKIAKDVDPDGCRTLAVVTKLDIMDNGTDAVDILCGRVIPVKLGIIGVVNRSQKDTQQGKSIKQCLIDEHTFLQSKYRHIAHKHGTEYLVNTLQHILMVRIKDYLPVLKSKITKLTSNYEGVLKTYGDKIEDKTALLLQAITEFSALYCCSIKGNLPDIETRELYGGARIHYIFTESFGKTLNAIHPLTGLTQASILTAIKNSTGTNTSVFIAELAFQLLVKTQINKLRQPSLRCVELVHEEMLKILQQCNSSSKLSLDRFPKLQQSICDKVTDLLNKRIPKTNEMVENLINIELAYINTKHPDFIRSTSSVCSLLKTNVIANRAHIEEFVQQSDIKNTARKMRRVQRSSTILSLSAERLQYPVKSAASGKHFTAEETGTGDSTDVDIRNKEQVDCAIIEHLISTYFNLVKRTIVDSVPKAIMHFLVNYVMEQLQPELVTCLYKPDKTEELLEESKYILNKRNEAKEMLNALSHARSIISAVKSSNSWYI